MLHSKFVNRLKQTMSDIRANPTHWDQSNWHCGTSHCFAGFAEVRAKLEQNNISMSKALNTSVGYNVTQLDTDLINNQYFGLSTHGWQTLINATNTMEQLAFIVDNLIENNGSIKIKYADYSPIENFSNMNLNYADLSYSNFEYANFYRTSLYRADLSYSNLSYADLRYANVVKANLDNVKLFSCSKKNLACGQV